MIKYLRNNLILIIAIFALIALGVFCIIIRGSDIISIFSILALIYLLAVGGWMIYSSFKYKDFLENNPNFLNKPRGYIIQGSLLVLGGILIIVFPDFLVRLAIGIFLIILPLTTLITHENKKQYIKNNFWKFIVGLIFILAFDVVLDILFIVIGVCLLLFSGFIIYLLIINYKENKFPNLITKYLMLYIIKKNNKGDIGE